MIDFRIRDPSQIESCWRMEDDQLFQDKFDADLEGQVKPVSLI